MRIAIIGAGPAGSMAAVHLARGGADVTLFDPSHPREKPCGGGVTGRALSLVGDALDLRSLPSVVSRAAIVEDPDGAAGPAEIALASRGASPGSSLVIFSRAVFDRALCDAAVRAGAALVTERAARVQHDRSGVDIHTGARVYRFDRVIGADGANSLVRKTFLRPFQRAHISVAAGYFVRGASDDRVIVRSTTDRPGYLWSFPRPDHLAVGVCAPAVTHASASALRAHALAWIEKLGTGVNFSPPQFLSPYAWPIPSIGFAAREDRRVAEGRWMLAGDAAGLVDPLTREGIYFALLSGVWAAEAILRSASPARTYQARVERELFPELARAARLSRMFFEPRFARLFVQALRKSRPICDVFADLVAGVQPYRGLRRRLLRTGEWKLAGQALQLVVQ